ncbi:hypothetical protein SUGI_0448040 [Cryptomeria japonica]|nr:hypothetical protein SUGI_0448040 [Cryptomeria japonica]
MQPAPSSFFSDGTLDPIAIELCLPSTSKRPCERRVFTPDYDGEDEGWLWQLAKAHVPSNDSRYQQIVSHWLRTHAVVEPFIVVTNRNMSKLHPLHKLLVPHFRNTMEINRLAREKLINAGGIIEQCFSPGQHAMEISAKAYVGWRLNEQGLPADLLKRGMAVPDPTNKVNGLKLVGEDYPYAVDWLEIWDALKSWVSDYISLYYCSDQAVKDDEEVEEWWEEIIEVGHEDKKDDEEGWYEMNTLSDLKEGITTIIWVASAHHAAVNFGQYDPVTTTSIMAVLQILSKHSTDEVYLCQGSASEWVDDPRVEKAFQQFQRKLLEIERKIKARNENPRLKNRCGAAKLPYTLLFPNTSDDSNIGGLTFRGIPNSISI